MLVERVTAPLHAPIAQAIHGVANHQIERFSRRPGALQARAEPNVTYLYHPVYWLYIQKASLAADFAAGLAAQRIENLVGITALLFEGMSVF